MRAASATKEAVAGGVTHLIKAGAPVVAHHLPGARPGEGFADVATADPAQAVGVARRRDQGAGPDQQVAREVAGQVGAEEREVGIGHRVDVGAHQPVGLGPELQVAAAEGDDPRVLGGPAGDREAVGPEPGAEDRLARHGGAAGVLDEIPAGARDGGADAGPRWTLPPAAATSAA